MESASGGDGSGSGGAGGTPASPELISLGAPRSPVVSSIPYNRTLNEREQRVEVAEDFFAKLRSYVQGEMGTAGAEFSLLQEMNEEATGKYDGMTQLMAHLATQLEGTGARLAATQPLLDSVEKAERDIDSLERTAKYLEKYVCEIERRLGVEPPVGASNAPG